MLTKEEVDHVADLARLYVAEEEYALYQKQLYDILEEINKIESVDVGDEKNIMISPCTNTNCYSQDQVGPMLSHDEIFKNVKHSMGDFIVVPRVITEQQEV